MKKLLKSLLGLVFIFIFILIPINVNADDITSIDIKNTEGTIVAQSRYYVQETKIENELPYGVKHFTDIGYASAPTGYCVTAAAGLGGGGTFVPDQFYPQQVNVLEIPATTQLQVIPWTNFSPSRWNKATVKAMATNFEENNPGYRVIGAINGDFFDMNGKKNFQYTPSGVHVYQGDVYKSTGGRAIGFLNDGSTNSLIGGLTNAKRTAKMQLDVYDENNTITNHFDIEKINQIPLDGEVAVYYANWDSSSSIVPISVNDAFIISQADFALPIAENDFYGKGTITSIGSKVLGERDFAIVSKDPLVSAALAVGVKIRAQFELTGAWANVDNVIGVKNAIIYNNEYQDDSSADLGKARHPRTMIGVKADGTIVMTVVDGRQPVDNMYGATHIEMAAILKHYGVKDAYNFDGGGSSTMVILKNGEFEVVNSPSDGIERTDGNAMLIVVRTPKIDYHVSDITPTGFTINANVIDKNGHTFDDLYVSINNDIKKIENGKAIYENLNYNTSYGYKFLINDGNSYSDLVIEDKIATSRRIPTLDSVKIFYDDSDLIFDIAITDPDNAINRKFVKIGDESIPLSSKGQAIFSNFEGDIFNNLAIEFSYDLNNGEGRQDIVTSSFKMQCGIDIFMCAISSELNEQIKNVLG